ncbi:NB-ARC domain-containing protein [Embleya sp. NPDC059237]|uniref:NB-ARC domain-containing protein n=1 Tax=Embleya sp. NPDC059237 TaxID=3346784 RepID=UPI003673A137
MPGVSATAGSNAAGRDLVNPVAIHAEYALPAEAYAPIPDDAARPGVANIRRTALFVGRTGELGALETAFTRTGEVVVHAVHGLGGVGKSALAAHWAAARDEPVRWWITAEDPAKVDAGLAALARALHPGLGTLPAELQTQRAVTWLAGHDDWLLVLDNVEDATHIDPLLDRIAGRGRILITTRRATGWHHHATTIRLDVLEPAEAVDLFTRILTHQGPRETDGADAVCAELGHLALAVEQAAAYCAETGAGDPLVRTHSRRRRAGPQPRSSVDCSGARGPGTGAVHVAGNGGHPQGGYGGPGLNSPAAGDVPSGVRL